ncbi:uncharacterized protein LOC129615189 [Condylostylus longicornis]|uniref:uncharacterized protein LOC129615189 n=1 Tax=Condylostylus longicornis TaxID=2530218 RepID=UPI00244E22E4|nr:uncharacterized protein LOC129615189 [Condylostylus longicornis]
MCPIAGHMYSCPEVLVESLESDCTQYIKKVQRNHTKIRENITKFEFNSLAGQIVAMSKIISDSECYKIISNFLKISAQKTILIHNYEVKQKVGEVVGFMGEYYGLKICYSINNNESQTENFFLKVVPVTNPLHKKEIEEKGFFEKEIGIYTKILKELEPYCDEKCFANCVYTRPDMMVFEDLTTKNYYNLKKNEMLTMEHFKVTLKSQATLHVSGMIYEYNTGVNIGEKYEKYLHEIQVNINNTWYAAGLKGIVAIAKIHPKYQNKNYQEFFQSELINYLLKAEEKVKISKKYRNVFCHRDSWDKNLLFKYDKNGLPIGCTFVDFQLTRYIPPAMDVLFFIYMNTNTKERENILEELLLFYFNNLQDKISKNNISDKNVITWKEFCDSCQEMKLVVLILCAMCFPLTKLPEGWADNMKQNQQDKFSYYMTVNRDEMLLNLMKEHEYYKNVLFEVHEELIHYIWKDINGKYLLLSSNDVRGYLGEYYNLRISIKKVSIYATCNWHPKCYYTRPDLLVFENLTHFGFRNLDDNEQITEQHLQVTLKCMAQMHCSSIVFEKKTGLCIGEKYKSNLFEISLNDTTGWFRAGLMAVRAAAKKIPKYQNENINEITPDPDNYEFLENFYKIMEVLTPLESTTLTKLDVQKCCQRFFMDNLDDNIRVITYEKTNIGNEPSGFLGDHQFLHVIVERSSSTGVVKHKLKFFLKCVPEAVLSHKEYIEELGVFQKEVHVYTQIIPRLTSINVSLGNFSPKCFFAKHNMLVFENLADQGFQMASERNGILDYEHLLAVMKVLANFHSASLILENRIGKPINDIFHDSLPENAYPTDTKGSRYAYVMKSIATLTEILEAIPKYKNSMKWNYIKNEFPKQLKKIFEFAKISKEFRNVINHGDLWANNVMFRYEIDQITQKQQIVDCRMVDFQLARFAPPMLDVITVLTIPTSRKFREDNLEKLVKKYYGFLENNLFQHEMNLNGILPLEEFMKSLDYYRLAGLIESCLFSHLTILPTDLTTSFLNNSTEFAEFLKNRRGELCLLAFNKDKIYRERLTDMISELVDNYILN